MDLRLDHYPLCVEKCVLITESYRETEGEPEPIRQAKAFANVLKKIPIWIDRDEYIVGKAASKPFGVELDPFLALWDVNQIKELETEGVIVVEEKDWAILEEMASYWKKRNRNYQSSQRFVNNETMFKFAKIGIALPPYRLKEEGIGAYAGSGLALYCGLHLGVPDYEGVLKKGLRFYINMAKDELSKLKLYTKKDLKKKFFLEGVMIALSAIIEFAQRYADLARELLEKESDPERRAVLLKIYEACSWVPENPARSFHEAIQSFWLIYLMCNPSPTIGMGRFDQYMYPFYKKDRDEGKITDEEVIDLLCELRRKDMSLIRIALRPEKRKQHAGVGQAKWHNMVIGGVDREGKDATNELTYLILEAAKRVRTPHHTITLRVHDGTPEDLMLKAIEVVKTGIGMPAFVGDKSYIEFLVLNGVPIEDARDYALGGCLDVALPGKGRLVEAPFFVFPKVFEMFLNGGVDPRTGIKIPEDWSVEVEKIGTFREFLGAFKRYMREILETWIAFVNSGSVAFWDNYHLLEATLMEGGIECGLGYLERRMPYDFNGTALAVGAINVINSLAVIKKLVFEEGRCSLGELKEALKNDWKGYEEIRKLCLKAPKYGNDNEYVDEIAAEIYNFYADEITKYKTANGARWVPGGISISSMWLGGAITGATPDGRFSGQVLADGSMSPAQGTDTNGPTAVIKSASKINQERFASTLLNMKLHPSCLKTAEDMKKLSALIKTYFSLGGKHIQFNVVSRETLIEAQKNPERYRDLIVRVAGYSAYFVQLGKAMQDEIIARTELAI